MLARQRQERILERGPRSAAACGVRTWSSARRLRHDDPARPRGAGRARAGRQGARRRDAPAPSAAPRSPASRPSRCRAARRRTAIAAAAAAARRARARRSALIRRHDHWALARHLRDVPVSPWSPTRSRWPRCCCHSGRTDQTVVLTGGLRTPSDALVGPVADAAIRSLHVDLLFMGVHGMDERSGFTTPNLIEAETNRALVGSARRLVVVADHTKWGIVGLTTIAALQRGRRPGHRRRAAGRGAARCSPSRSASWWSHRSRDRPGRLRATDRGTLRGRPGDHLLRRHATRRPRTAVDDPRPAARLDAAPRSATTSLLGEWVAVASHRQSRTLPAAGRRLPAVPVTRRTARPRSRRADYDVVVFENRFPSFAGADGAPSTATSCSPRRPGVGRCEVVCFTCRPRRARSPTCRPQRVRTVIEAWVDRTVELSALAGVEQVFCFENRGEEIGVTLSHPHGQIYALSVRDAADRAGCSTSARAPPRAHRAQPVRRRAGAPSCATGAAS